MKQELKQIVQAGQREKNANNGLQPNRTVSNVIRNTLMFCLASVISIGVGTTLNAEEAKTPAASQKPTRLPLTGKIVALNNPSKTLTVEIKGKIYVFKVSPKVRIMKDGKEVSPDELAVGQQVGIDARPGDNAGLEIVMLNIEASPDSAEPAGDKTKGADKGKGTPPTVTPPRGQPVGPPPIVVSPHR